MIPLRRRLLFALVPTLLLFGLVEFALRLFWTPPGDLAVSQSLKGTLLAPHPTRMWAPEPGEIEQFGAKVRIDENRMRAVPLTGAPLKVVTLGDSSIFGHGLEDPDTLHVKLSEALAARGVSADVLCGGIPGYSTEQSLVLLEEAIFDLKPDLLLIGNLWSDCNIDNFVDREWMAEMRDPVKRVERALASLYLVRALTPPKKLDSTGDTTVYVAVTWIRDPYSTGRRRVPVSEYAANLDRMLAEAAAHQVGAAIFQPADTTRYAGIDGNTSFRPYFDAGKTIAARRKIPVIDALDAIRGSGKSNEELFIDGLHPSGLGNSLYAAHIADSLAEAGWPKERLVPDPSPAPFNETLADPWAERNAKNSELDDFAFYLDALRRIAADPADGAAACAKIDAEWMAADCAWASAEAWASRDDAAARAICAEQKGDTAQECWLLLAEALNAPELCARSGDLSAICWERNLVAPPTLRWLPADARPGTVEPRVSELLAAAERPVDDGVIWDKVYRQILPKSASISDCAPVADPAIAARCRGAVSARFDELCFAPDGDYFALLSQGQPRWPDAPIGRMEAIVRGRLVELGIPEDHACTWRHVYREVLRAEEPVLSVRCEDAERPALCLEAIDTIYAEYLGNTQRSGQLTCTGAPPHRFRTLDDPRFIAMLNQWRAEGRCNPEARNEGRPPRLPK